MISVITCSIDNEKFARFEAQLGRAIRSDYELIKIPDADSLTEGYQRGALQASGDVLIFCHDDVEFLNDNLDTLIMEDLERCQILGVAGTSRLGEGNWVSMGYPYLHGQIATWKPQDTQATLYLYGCGQDEVFQDGLQALDGVFFAMKRESLRELHFDTEVFNGFHLYDLDFTYAAFLHGMSIAVDHRIHILHHSGGSYNVTWRRYRHRFNRKYRGRLNKLPNDRKPLVYYRGDTCRDREELKAEMENNSNLFRVDFLSKDRVRPGSFRIGTPGSPDCDAFWELGNAIPLEDNQVDFFRSDFALNYGDPINWLPEIERVCKHNAILELGGNPNLLSVLSEFAVNGGRTFANGRGKTFPYALCIFAFEEEPMTRVICKLLKHPQVIASALERFLGE